MSAAISIVDGARRIRIGLCLLRRACRDALRGAGLVFSGIGAVFVGAVQYVWTSAGALLGGIPGLARVAASAPRGVARTARWLSVALPRWFGTGAALVVAALKLVFWLLSAAVWAFLVWLLANLDWKAAVPPFLEAVPVILAVLLAVGAAVLAVFLLGWLLEWIGRLLARLRVRVRWPAAGAAIVSACALFAALVMFNLQGAPKSPQPPIAPLANVAFFAGAALFAVFAVFALFTGFALISFGRAGVAAVSIGGARRTHADSASETLCEAHEPVKQETARPPQQEEPTIAASPEAPPPRSEPNSGAPRSRWFYRLTAIGLALAIFGALAVLWSKSPEQNVQRRAAAVPSVTERTPAPGKTPSLSPAQAAPSGLVAIVPIADDRPGDLVWRNGYRALTERLHDGAPASRLALPRRACSAQALLAFGSASSDGARDANARLARRRALWAAEWARRELASCPPGTTAPAILAISLGQAEGSPDARQRRVRLLAIERGSGLLFSDPAALRRSSAAIFPDVQSFSAFEVCLASGGATGLHIAPCQ